MTKRREDDGTEAESDGIDLYEAHAATYHSAAERLGVDDSAMEPDAWDSHQQALAEALDAVKPSIEAAFGRCLLDKIVDAIAPSDPSLEPLFQATDADIVRHVREVVACLQSEVAHGT